MNPNLQIILDFIQQIEDKTAEEKEALVKAAKKVKSDLDIAEFKLERTEKVKRTTAILLEETIEELEQKRKAVEAQNRELEIETALERVRTIAMGMNKADELLGICEALFKELQKLGFTELRNAMINIHNDEDESFLNYDFSDFAGAVVARIDYNIYHSVQTLVDQSRNSNNAFIEYEYTGQELADWKALRKKNGEYDDPRVEDKTSLYYYFYSIGIGSVGISTFNAIGEEGLELLKRFRNVFDLAYRRYIDITNAEAQAREAEIELALERVRARTMAMHKSEELAETAAVLFEQLSILGNTPERINLGIFKEEENLIEWWITTQEGLQVKNNFITKVDDHPVLAGMFRAWKENKKTHIVNLSGDAVAEWIQYITKFVGMPVNPELVQEQRFLTSAYFSRGLIGTTTSNPLPKETINLLERFAGVFQQTYTRFLDLQKAEAQAREAQIEAALERTRTQSMIMQHSKELDDTLKVFHEQVLLLGIPSAFSFLWLPDEEKSRHIFWAAWAEDGPGKGRDTTGVFKSKAINYPLDPAEPATAQCLIDWKSDEPVHSYQVKPAEVEQYFAAWAALLDGVEKLKPEYFSGGLHYVEAFMKYGCFGVMVTDDLTGEEKKILARFAIEFERTYTRFLDLQKAEAQAREAQIEAALERVRSRTMSMQRSDELAETAAVLFRQLVLLGIEPNRLYIGIIKNDNDQIEFWATDEEGSKVSTQFIGDARRNASMKKMYDAWKAEQKSLTIDMQGKELSDYFQYMTDELNVSFTKGISQKRRIQTIAIFGKGFLGIASPDEQPPATMQLLERFAAVFNLTYTRFNDLQIAEEHAIQAEEDLIKLQTEKKRAEDALNDLQATQKQLIQSEKMASLGELTAGIAHEIQNPLNFVNNFSDVSTELVDEMNEELDLGNIEEAKQLANDLKQNLEKINHHGKRAGDIVKGMLQHSRTSSGQKELADINALADEYLRLAYHGLRAKDKTFNAAMKTDYDENIGLIKIIPQDIGRVILNLITNAFYAVTERSKLTSGGFEPMVAVSTLNHGDRIEIAVKDNGGGIPQHVLDKIFQPFFTTKPTGRGTGLGLSLSYDIVKAHGGELKVETKEARPDDPVGRGEGSTFIIYLPIVQ